MFFFGEKGYQTVALPDGQAAISYAKHKKPDLVLLDIKMPGLNGFETSRRLKQILHSSPPIGIIIITGYGSPENVAKSFSSGALDVIRKPFDLDDVNHRINLWFDLSIFEDELARILAYADEINSYKGKNNEYKD